MRLLILRAEAGRTAALARDRGLEPVILPLERIVHLDPPLPHGAFAASIATSGHAVPWLVRHAPGLPLWAVGSRTAGLARDAGMATVVDCGGDAASLSRVILASPPNGPCLYAAGAVRRPELEETLARRGVVVYTAETYRAEFCEPAAETVAGLAAAGPIEAALVLSVGQAQAFAWLADRYPALVCGATRAFCLSRRIEAALPANLARSAATPGRPTLEELVDAAKAYCCSMTKRLYMQ